MSNIQTSGTSQLQRLQELQAQNNNAKKRSNLTAFNDLVGVYLGFESKEYFPKLKDANGKKIKDEKGLDKRSEKSSGYLYRFSEFSTSKMIMIVLPEKLNLKLLSAYKLSGLGFDSFASYFLEEDTKIANF